MSQPLPTPMPLGEEELPAAETQAPAHEGPMATCGCSKCGLYRWYPPLLMLSTIMAGVFCWMYVTKPVFLSPARSVEPGAVQPAIQDLDPGQTEQGEASTAGAVRALDPALAGIPEAETAPAEPPAIGFDELEPLVVDPDRSRKLFTPLEEEIPGAPPAEYVAPAELVEEAPRESVEELSDGPALLESQPLVPDPGSHFADAGDPDFVGNLATEVARGAVAVSFVEPAPANSLGSSFMTDFLVSGEAETGPPDLLTAEENAVRWINQLAD